MRPLLADPGLQAQVERDGFVVVPLLSPAQVDRLLALYRERIRPADVSGLYESSRHNSYETNRIINDRIRDEVVAGGRALFQPATVYGGTFMVKSARDSEVLPLHQDWSVVEEAQHATLFVWCPLLDVSAQNGGLFVLPGSHRFFRTLRSGSYPSDRFLLPPSLHRCTRDISLRAGEAILYSDQLFHGSHANHGGADRVVVTARLVEPGADLVYFHRASATEVDVYAADERFYLTHIDALAKGRAPAAAPRYRRPYVHDAVTGARLQSAVRHHFSLAPEGLAMQRLFRDPALQTGFERDGFAVLDLIDRQAVADLLEFYRGLRHAATPAHGFQVSLDHDDPGFVREVADRLVATVAVGVDRHFEGHRIFTASFVTKAKHPLGVVPPHQDWTFVDEPACWSATIWCPLVDVDVDNGALGVIKGSHRFYDHVRPSPSPHYAPPFADQLAAIVPYLTMVPLRAGQALVFDNRTLHASPPNTTDRTRVAFGIGITQRDAALRHYFLLPGGGRQVMEGYEVEPGFFHHYNNARLAALYERGQTPAGLRSLGRFAVGARDYTAAALVEVMERAGNRPDPALAARMAGAFQAGAAASDAPADADAGDGAAPARRDRPLWKVYTPANIAREIRYRVGRWRSA